MRAMVALCFLTLVGCGGGNKSKTKADLETEYGAKLKPRMEALVAAGKVADQNRSTLGTSGGPADIDVDYNAPEDKHTGNTVIVQFDDLASLTEDAAPTFRFADLDRDHVRTAKSWTGAKVGLQSGDWTTFEPALQRVIGAKYVLVVFPELIKAADMGIGGTTFTPGQAKATVVLVEIDGAKPHGGFEVTATNSDELMSKSKSVTEKQKKVDKDLVAQLGKAISGGIEKRWKGAKSPYNWSEGW